MEEYLEFLNLISLYNEIIDLDDHISTYIKCCENNKDDKKTHANLTKRLEEYKNRRMNILNSNGIPSYIPLLYNIITKWDDIVKKGILFNIDINSILDKNGKPLYIIILSIVNKREEFKHIYKYLIENGLYDPNRIYGVSDEPFFSILPDFSIYDLKECNKKVTTNSETDFHILRNGTDMLYYALVSLKEAKGIEERDYWCEYIMWCLQGSYSVLDSKRYQSTLKKVTYDYVPKIFNLYSSEFYVPQNVRDYLLTEECVIKQCENSIYPSQERNEAIDFYVSKLNIDENVKKRLVDLKI